VRRAPWQQTPLTQAGYGAERQKFLREAAIFIFSALS